MGEGCALPCGDIPPSKDVLGNSLTGGVIPEEAKLLSTSELELLIGGLPEPLSTAVCYTGAFC
jgi:hypothetical protein